MRLTFLLPNLYLSPEARVYDRRVEPALCHVFLPGSTAPNDLPRIGALRQSRRAIIFTGGFADVGVALWRVRTGHG